jgi:hypothetical protein
MDNRLPIKHEPLITRRSLTVPEKVKQIIDLPKISLPHIAERRAVNYWQRVWPLRAR